MQKTTLWISALVLVVVIVGVFIYISNSDTVLDMASESAVRNTVTEFGSKLKMVSLLAPTQDIVLAMDQNYAAYVTVETLTDWKRDPSGAPGRLTSSPFPDSISISTVDKNPDNTFTVTGAVIEATNREGTTTPNGSYPVTVTLENRSGSWLISGFKGYNVQ